MNETERRLEALAKSHMHGRLSDREFIQAVLRLIPPTLHERTPS